MSTTGSFPGMDGRSLENSYTNIFALTDLSEIYFQTYVCRNEKKCGINDDPVLSSYSNCLKKDVMCAWVRPKKDDTKPQKSLVFANFSKELWVFWYGSSDPTSWEGCISPELRKKSGGSWKDRLNYETRCVLFKALHNVVEKCLLKKGFLRLGKWFLQPCSSLLNRDKVQYSISFSFFLHGESTVCASLDIRQNPKVKILNPRIFALCMKAEEKANVILAPYGLSARLVAPSPLSKDALNDCLNSWNSFFPMQFEGADFSPLSTYLNAGSFGESADLSTPNKASPSHQTGKGDASSKKLAGLPSIEKIPRFVDVLVGGYRMRYPACFVLIAEDTLESLLSASCPRPLLPIFDGAAVSHSSDEQSADFHFSLDQPDLKTVKFTSYSSSNKTNSPRIPLRSMPSGRKRAYFAGRALRRVLRNEQTLTTPILSDDRLLDIYLNYTLSPLHMPRSLAPSSIAHGFGETNGRRQNQTPSTSSTGPPPILLPLHQRTSQISQATRNFLDGLDNYCDRAKSPPVTSTDPMMPALSPQQPAPSGHQPPQSQNVPPVVSNCVNPAVDLTPNLSVVLHASTTGGRGCTSLSSNLPPCLVNHPVLSQKNSPVIKYEEPEKNLNPKLPLGMRRASPTRKFQLPSPAGLLAAKSEDSAYSRSLRNSWLMEQAAKELQRGASTIHKRPSISFSLVDRLNVLEHPLSSPMLHFESRSMKNSCLEDSTMGLHEVAYRSEEPIIFPSSLSNSTCSSSIESTWLTSIHSKDSDLCGYPQSEELRDMDEDSCKPDARAHRLSRTSMRRLPPGRSLRSSSGSGRVDPSELALMYPTPPSHDTLLPSPADSLSQSVVLGLHSGPCTPSPVAAGMDYGEHRGGGTESTENPTVAAPCVPIASDLHAQASLKLELFAQTFPHLTRLPSDSVSSSDNVSFSTDWLFMRLWPQQHQIASKYQMSSEDFLLYRESLPKSLYVYDHCTLPCDHVNQLFDQAHSPAAALSTMLASPKPYQPAAIISDAATHDILDPLCVSIVKPPVEATVASVDLCEIRETDALKVVLILSDSLLNIFKDHNFDSCNICECTRSVLGSEVDVYLPSPKLPPTPLPGSVPPISMAGPWSGVPDNDFLSSTCMPQSCDCGFSATVNRRHAVAGNLFYEDEVEISMLSIARVYLTEKENSTELLPRLPLPPPLPQMPCSPPRNDGWWAGKGAPSAEQMDLLHRWCRGSLEEFGVRFLVDWLHHAEVVEVPSKMGSLLDYSDACALTVSAMEESIINPRCLENWMGDEADKAINHPDGLRRLDEATREEGIAFHPAFFHCSSAEIPANKNDQIRLLESIRPWLQEAMSSSRLLEVSYVHGPLTWKAFHQMAGRGTNESSEPQPIPKFLVCGGGDASRRKDSLLISPFGVRDWDCLGLAPLSRPKRIAFAVLLPSVFRPPSVSFMPHPPQSTRQRQPLNCVAEFFRELSHTFENCRLGLHYPFHNPILGSPETSFIYVPSPSDALDLDASTMASLAPLPSDLRRRLLRRLQSHSPSPDLFLQHLQSYVAGAIHGMVKTLAERGVAMPDGRRSALAFFPSFSHTAAFATSATSMATSAGVVPTSDKDRPLPIASKTNPASGQGPLTTAYDSSLRDNIDEDTYLLIYLVNPFTQFADMDLEVWRLTVQALTGAASRILTFLPEAWRQRVSVHLLPLEHVLLPSEYLPRLRSMALSVYSAVDRLIEPSLVNANRTLTGMGPAAEKEVISAKNERQHARRVYSPAYALAPVRDLWGQWGVHPSEPLETSSVLFVSYCLSEDHQWLLAACTDEQGSILEHTYINIRVPLIESMSPFTPDGSSSTAAAADASLFSSRRLGLAYLWDFIIKVVASTSNPWRLVIGRLGRLGHGELKGWSRLLGRESIQNVNSSLRANCHLCGLSTSAPCTSGHMYAGKMSSTISLVSGSNCSVSSCTHELPSLLSTCLVSLEPQTTFRLFPCSDLLHTSLPGGGGGAGGNTGGFGASGGGGGCSGSSVGSGGIVTGGATFGSGGTCPFAGGLFSPFNYAPSTTHILVFPTSASAQAQQETDFSMLDLPCNELFQDPTFDMLDDPAINNYPIMLDYTHTEHPNSTQMKLRMEPANIAKPATVGLSYEAACRVLAKHYLSDALLPFGVPDDQMEHPNLMQQPLAMAYYISTAPTGPIPAWFWSTCQQVSQTNPVCLKSALHLHFSLVGNDDATTVASATLNGRSSSCSAGSASEGYAGHLLDSTKTCDVLRFVLESYNSLSWLTYDPVVNDRRSCLPFHILALSQLAQATKAFS